MRLTLPNQQQIDHLSKPLGDALRALRGNLGTWGDKEHRADGKHADLTATSAAVSGLTTLGKLRLRYVSYNDNGTGSVNDLVVAGLSSVSWLRIFPAAALTITGINANERDLGDTLLITNNDSGGSTFNLTLAVENGNSIATNRFQQSNTLAAGGPYTVPVGRGVWLMYDAFYTSVSGVPQKRWTVIDSI